jgi:hypothetical protein
MGLLLITELSSYVQSLIKCKPLNKNCSLSNRNSVRVLADFTLYLPYGKAEDQDTNKKV